MNWSLSKGIQMPRLISSVHLLAAILLLLCAMLSSAAGVDCDFDDNGTCDIVDLDALMYLGLDNQGQQFDLDENGSVDLADRDVWLLDAGTRNGIEYVVGDADLNGKVNADADMNEVGVNWQRTDATSWLQADFNGDHFVNSIDLNYIGVSWQHGVGRRASLVPEPSSWTMMLPLLFGLSRKRKLTQHVSSSRVSS